MFEERHLSGKGTKVREAKLREVRLRCFEQQTEHKQLKKLKNYLTRLAHRANTLAHD